MSVTIITEYASIGGITANGATPQIPCEVVRRAEYDSSTGQNHVFHPTTRFFGLISDTAQNFNFDTADSAGDTLTSGNRDRVAADERFYQAIKTPNGDALYTQINVKDA